MMDQRFSDNDQSKRDIPSFIEPLPPLISNPFMRPRPQKGTNLLELFEEDSEIEEPELVQVYLRLKPYHARNNLYEVRSDRCLITSVDTATAGHGRRTQHNVSKMYTFSHIFGPEATQKEIFENVVKENLKKLPDGHNFTLLTYGASGSGKTYTLMGTVASPGLVPRSLEYVFRVVDAAQMPVYKPVDGASEKLNLAEQGYELQWVKRLRNISAPLRDKYRRMSAGLCNDLTVSSMDLSNRTRHYVWVSFVEIYNEGIYDLLVPGDRRTGSKLRIREDASGNVYVKDVTQAFVRTGEEAYDVMVAGKHNLQVAATGVHAHSSRSHCIFTITMLTETESGVRSACVRLCDLAGCERARRTRNTGARLQESRAINSSLHVLERCLHTLRRRQRRAAATCVPYRESKLTRLLGAGLSGARGEAVSMVVTLNPAPEYAHETKHVLQLAAVARDIQVNSTIAETSLESSAQDTTVGSGAEAMRLRADNERLHFELLQAQSRNKELLAAMEERQQEAAVTMRELVEEAKDMTRQYYEAQMQALRDENPLELLAAMEERQQEAADTMRELVEEAKDMTRQYYEAQMQALRDEMEDLVEEYESRLSKPAPPALGGSGTPSRALQNKVAQLMTEIAILEEKLTAERLARARAEEEVQHLRACIEERDEKEAEENQPEKDVMLLSDSEHDSEEEIDDPCNESLEPTFKKEDINRSILMAKKAFDETSIQSDKTLDESERNDVTENDNNDSAINKSEETVKDHDNTETTMDSVYATGEEDSASTNKSADNRNSNNISGLRHPSTDKSCEDNQISAAKKQSVLIESFDYKESDTVNVKKDSAPRGTYFIRSNDVLEDDDSTEDVNVKKPDSLTRGTYFVKDSQCKDIPSEKISNDKVMKEPLIQSFADEIPKTKAKVSDTVVNKIIKSFKTSQGSNTSLAQFEQLEMAAKNFDETRVGRNVSSGFGNINIWKEKKTYFEETSKDPNLKKLDEVEEMIPIKDNKSHTYSEELFSKESVLNKPDKEKLISASKSVDLDPAPKSTKNKKSHTYFDERSSNEIVLNEQDKEQLISGSKLENLDPAPKSIKDTKARTYFDETSLKETVLNKPENGDLVLASKSNKEKKTYFDNIDANIESAPNKKVNEVASIESAPNKNVNELNLQVDDTRSPSIIKDEMANDFRPSTIKKLLGKSFTRRTETDSSVTNNKIIKKKQDSVDIFEGLDSPLPIVKTTESIVENARKSIEQMVLDQRSASKVKQEIKLEPETISEESYEISPIPLVDDPSANAKTIGNKDVPPIKTDEIPPTNTKTSIDILSTNTKTGKTDVTSMSTVDIPSKNSKTITVKDVNNTDNTSQVKENDNAKAESQNVTVNNTIEEFENLCKDISTSRATEFEILVSHNATKSNDDNRNTSVEEKYNLRHKTHKETVKFADKVEKEDEEVLLESNAKCERNKPTKRSLRLRRRKNQTEESSDQEGDRLKDIVNLQKEFSDVTMDVPAQVKQVKDIQSPEKVPEEDENVPPLMGIQSCPSKSVTRSRRKLFTPRAEPLDEAEPATGASGERVRVPRPSYHRPRARRKL